MTGNQSRQNTSPERLLTLLRKGHLLEDQDALLPWSSNYTFLMVIQDAELEANVIYKPRRGERPLWDFPDGTLCQREVAAYVISEALGWNIVPPTVLRDGPYGIGMVQLHVEADPAENYFTFSPDLRPQLQRIALFDHIANNADRKGGHCLLSGDGHLWAIDHGLCFHAQPKLRTVIWDFAGEPIPPNLLRDTQSLSQKLADDQALQANLQALLNDQEIHALRQRTKRLRQTGTYPEPGPGRNYPWPPV